MIKSFLKRYWHHYVIGIFVLVLVDLSQLFIPRLIGRVVDQLKQPQPDQSMISLMISWIMGIALGMAILRFFWRYFIIGASRRFEYISRNFLFEKLLSLTPGYFDQNRSGDLMAKLTNDLQAVRMALAQGVVLSVDATFMAIMTLIFMGRTVNWRLTWLSTIPLPGLAFIALFFGRMIHRRFMQVQKEYSSLSELTEETILGVRIIKSFSANDRIHQMFNDRSMRNYESAMSLARVSSLFFPLMTFFAAMSQVLALSFGGKMVINGLVTLGEFVAFNSYLGMLTWPMMALGWVLNMIQRGRASHERLMEIVKQKPQIDEPEIPVRISAIEKIEFRDLTYRYPGTSRDVLKEINLSFRKGDMVGIVGTVGSGKSTLVRVLAKLYPVERGKVFINGVDINDISSANLRSLIAFVPQESFLFSDQIKKNIAFAQQNIELDKVVNYSKLASVHSEIEKFPEGYDTIVGERGVTLSGGQKQRVTIARALYTERDLLIFDDCLSAVDPETEEKIISALRENYREKTMIVITHRLKVLRDADLIVVLDDGKIVEMGTHEELMANEQMYSRMYRKQMIEEELECE